MTRALLMLPVAAVLLLGSAPVADAHCEVPCGIFADQMRFEMMLEDHATIAKAMAQIESLAAKTDGASVNQRTRWVMTKEDHAKKTMGVIAQYFMAQRLKPGKDAASSALYVDKLTKAHAVMRAAMKCKQSVAAKDADAFKAAIMAFHQAYTNK
jgi:nickel superoxide dismutase